MKTLNKIFTGAGIAVAAGAILIGIGISLLEKRPDSQTREYEEKIYTAGENITEICASLAYEDIIVEPADVASIECTYKDNVKEPLYTISEKNGTLQIRRKSSGVNIPIFYTDFFSDDNTSGSIAIKIPRDTVLGADFGTTSGNLTISDLEVKKLHFNGTSGNVTAKHLTVNGKLSADTTSGDMYFEDISVAGDFLCDSTSGSVDMEGITAKGDIRVNKTSGDWRLSNVTAEGSLSMDSTSGGIDGNFVSAKSVFMDTTSGNVAFTQLTVAEKIDVDGTSSDVRIGLTDAWGNYRIDVDTLSGSSNLPEHYNGDSEKEIRISTTSGDVWVE